MSETGSYGLAGQLAIVTGAAQGIGSALAQGLAEQGCRVALIDYAASQLEEVAARLRATGGAASAFPCDLRDTSAIRTVTENLVTRLGTPDILVNNAAWTATVPFLDVTEAEWDQTLDTGVKGLFFLSQATARHMAARGRGSVIHVGSQLGVAAFAGRSVYGARKGGVHHLTRCMALELGPLGIRVNAVAPCITETATRRNLLENPEYVQWVKSMLPVGRWAQPEDVVGPVLFLASEQSAMVNGHVLMVDGGWTIH